MALTNGSSSGHFEIVFGLMNQEGKYLTAEKFGNQISVTGTSLRAKQLWVFEPEGGEGSTKGYLRSPQNNYLETSKTGTVVCDKDEKESSFLFDVTISDDGRWAFKDSFGKFLAGNTERLYTTMDSKQADEYLWAIHIAAHPQCNMKSISRKRYVYLNDDELNANADIPWGQDSVITVEFQKGKYALRDSQGRYLNGNSGKLVDKMDPECLLVLSLQGNDFAFKASNGKYLQVHGPKGHLIGNKQNADKDALFSLEESKAQVTLTANNGKKASIRQGIDVTANQFLEPEDSETFQVGYTDDGNVTFVAKNKKYWKASPKSITASSDTATPECLFQMEWKNEKVALKANSNGNYITSSSGGQLAPTSDSTDDENALFTIELMNRQILVLRCEHGYIGITGTNDKIQCNRGAYDAMQVENNEGKYRLKTSTGKAWKVDPSGALVMADMDSGDSFLFVFCGKNKMKIRADNGKFLKGDHNGTITANGEENDKSITWEY